MKSRRFYLEKKKQENPQVEQKDNTSRKIKYGYASNASNVSNPSNASNASNVYTVKETTIEKRIKRTNNNIQESSNKTEKIETSNLKQGTNSGFTSQNKIPVSNKEVITEKQITTSRFRRNYRSKYLDKDNKRYTEKELQQIIKIQNWWRRMLAILNGYKIRKTLR